MPEDKNRVETKDENQEPKEEESKEQSAPEQVIDMENLELVIKEQKIGELEAEIAKLNDTMLRNEAEYQNLKKRMEREKARAIEYAYEGFAYDLLNVIDSLENGAKSFDIHDGENDELYDKVKEGFNLTLEQFQKVFEKHKIESIENSEFDPNVHNAIMQVESETHNEGDVVETYQKGYKIKERILRPAMVSVAK